MTEAVTLSRVTTTVDRYGNGTSSASSSSYDVLAEPVFSTESDSMAPPVVVGYRLYLRGEFVDADSNDTVTFRGSTWRVQGHSAIWQGSPGGTVITIVRGAPA